MFPEQNHGLLPERNKQGAQQALFCQEGRGAKENWVGGGGQKQGEPPPDFGRPKARPAEVAVETFAKLQNTQRLLLSLWSTSFGAVFFWGVAQKVRGPPWETRISWYLQGNHQTSGFLKEGAGFRPSTVALAHFAKGC